MGICSSQVVEAARAALRCAPVLRKPGYLGGWPNGKATVSKTVSIRVRFPALLFCSVPTEAWLTQEGHLSHRGSWTPGRACPWKTTTSYRDADRLSWLEGIGDSPFASSSPGIRGPYTGSSWIVTTQRSCLAFPRVSSPSLRKRGL